MTTSVGNNSVFKSFFEKQKLTGPNFIDWYRQLCLALAAHAAWVKGQKEVDELKAMYSKQAEQELLQTGLQGSKKLKPGALSLYVGDGHHAAVEAIETYHLELPSGLAIVLNNCHYPPSITRVVPRDGIYEIDMSCSNTNDSSILSENKVFVAQNAEFFESKLLDLKVSGSVEDLELIQEEDTNPSIDTSLNHEEDDQEIDEPQSDINPIRKSSRTRCTPDRMCLYIDAEEHELGDLGEPANYKAALLDPKSKKWLDAMNVEMQSMKDNDVWILVELPSNARTIGSKWLFKKKTDMDGAVYIFKARLVAKGVTQIYEVDYEETFSPVAEIRAIRILIAIVAYYDYEIWQIDVKIAFHNGHLSEKVYMEQHEGVMNPKYPNHKFGFTQNPDEPCVYLKASGSYIAILILYVDDILLMGNNIPMLQDVKSYLRRSFAMKDLGLASYILGIKIYRDRSKRLISLCQKAYIEKILKRFYMENSKCGTIPMQEKLKLSKSQGASTPAEKQRMKNIPYALAVGSIMYAVRCTHPDVAFAQNMTSRFEQNPGEEHWTAVKIFLSIFGIIRIYFWYMETRYVFIVNGGAVDWKSTKQSIFATSSTDSEYIASFDASKEVVWIRKFISGLGIVPTIKKPISMYCGNTGAMAIAKDGGVTKGAIHFHAKVHYIRETIKLGDVKIEKIDIDDNLVDPFTKALAFSKHSELTRNIGLLPANSFM
nr:hypothetical protein [Tanacetum cinerariifolium]